jgi:hypothetical protein
MAAQLVALDQGSCLHRLRWLSTYSALPSLLCSSYRTQRRNMTVLTLSECTALSSGNLADRVRASRNWSGSVETGSVETKTLYLQGQEFSFLQGRLRVHLCTWRWQCAVVLRRVVSYVLTDVSEVRPAAVALIVGAPRASELTVCFYQATRRSITEDCPLFPL